MDLQAVDDNKFFDKSIMNHNLPYLTTFDPQYSISKDSFVTHVVEPTMLVPCAQNAFQNTNMDEGERIRLASLVDPHHEYYVQQDDLTPTPWDMQLEDHGATTLMPHTPTNELQEVWKSEDHVPSVAAPNLTPTTLQEKEQNIVPDVPATILY